MLKQSILVRSLVLESIGLNLLANLRDQIG
ncbi:Uncharacterised protein [Vibrio cholerae]|nr:Uncharacterised protein [Vibrio cholerae]CSI82427.1 Uncharacterised protein [Vibrio cholerae]